ncbi:uncharacterized protein [Littorina saxatilis]|uniref:Anaphase-promoting complex subunit 16 n=1 Tax=Littorina saxatilis TaxID=31220 RepID=A0AAN9BXJ5_9CAEN
MSNQLLVQLLTQPHLQSTEAARTGPSSNKYVLNLASCTMMSKVQLEQAIDMNTHALQKDLHDQRVKQLRKLMKDIDEDDWQYESVEKLIGLR